MKVSIVGQGYVGLTLAVGASSAGHQVIGVDIDSVLINNLKVGKTLIPGIDGNELISLIKDGNYFPTNDIKDIENSEIIVIAVPTPLSKDRTPDLTLLKDACLSISKYLKSSTLIINESTSFPGTLRNFIKPIFDSRKDIVLKFAVAPERVDPANTVWNLKNTPRVIGGLTEDASISAYNFYRTFCDEVLVVSKPEVAEAAKLFENTFRQVNIALVNEFAQIASKLDFSTFETIKAAQTKPFGFMSFYPSIGVGGHCIPIDPTYLSYSAELVGINANFINLANKTNLEMVSFTVSKIESKVNRPLKNLKVQLAGIAYKTNVADIREAPALLLMEKLISYGAIVSWYDPLIEADIPGKQEKLQTDIDLGLIITPHEEINFTEWAKSNTNVLDLSSNSNDYGWPKFL